jgi:hypothetical protein
VHAQANRIVRKLAFFSFELLCRCSSDQDFAFDFINGAPARFDTVFDALLHNSSPIMPQLHLNFTNFPTNSARHVALNTRKVEYLREEPTFSHGFGTPPPSTSIPESGFQQVHTPSRPRRYCQKTQLPDPVQGFPERVSAEQPLPPFEISRNANG